MNDFFQATGFDGFRKLGTVRKLGGDAWTLVFAEQDDAVSFARYAAGFVRRVMPNVQTRADAQWGERSKGWLARVSICCAGGPTEEGVVICRDNEVFGIGIIKDGAPVVFPIKAWAACAISDSGSMYVLFEDGSGFCRSRSDGPQKVAVQLLFVRSGTDLDNAFKRGGPVLVSAVPAAGLYPVYLYKRYTPDASGCVLLEKDTFRKGTHIVRVLRP